MTCRVCGCPDTKWLRVQTVADRFECSTKKVRRLILSGQLEGVRLGREWRVEHRSLDHLVREWSLEGGMEPGSLPGGPAKVRRASGRFTCQ